MNTGYLVSHRLLKLRAYCSLELFFCLPLLINRIISRNTFLKNVKIVLLFFLLWFLNIFIFLYLLVFFIILIDPLFTGFLHYSFLISNQIQLLILISAFFLTISLMDFFTYFSFFSIFFH